MARTDGLPDPVTVGDLYLAAILKELRDLNRPVAPAAGESVERVKEPENSTVTGYSRGGSGKRK